ncbi:hypothetical protein caldi_05940 [Caldinitratiruptor microaerophilus]|uniref:Uncharacterized protein n=1 Tax=Caldinitratiruptor microaerophilus TaxID=671077 RepID=A0AA35CI63_9FIRM|nr:hypothetical protein caldi_05940 [Caldinitratiruptor microaerophilus]
MLSESLYHIAVRAMIIPTLDSAMPRIWNFWANAPAATDVSGFSPNAAIKDPIAFVNASIGFVYQGASKSVPTTMTT